MNPNTKRAVSWSLASLASGLVTPSLVIFCLQVFIGGISPFAAVSDILQRQFAEGHNLFLLAAFGLIPFVFFSVACFIAAGSLTPPRLTCVAIGGLVGILAVMVPAHASIWYPLYGPGRISSTAVIGFIFIPFYCIGTLLVGMLLGWLFSLLPFFRHATNVA